MSAEQTAVTSTTEKLLELIALESAHTRLRETVIPGDEHLTEFDEAIAKRQATLNMLPAQLKADRLRVAVTFTYYDVGGFGALTPPKEVKEELERKVWQDPDLSAKLSAAREMIVVTRVALMAGIGLTPSAKFYAEPKYTVN
jgi:hypothetical protein